MGNLPERKREFLNRTKKLKRKAEKIPHYQKTIIRILKILILKRISKILKMRRIVKLRKRNKYQKTNNFQNKKVNKIIKMELT